MERAPPSVSEGEARKSDTLKVFKLFVMPVNKLFLADFTLTSYEIPGSKGLSDPKPPDKVFKVFYPVFHVYQIYQYNLFYFLTYFFSE